jgi:sugar lactone lactonase YvrE
MTIRSILRLIAVAVLGVVLCVPLGGAAQARPFPDRIDLPNGFMPEGITIGPGATAYLGSRANGDIFVVNLRTGESQVISGLGPVPSVGLKISNQGYLFVAGGSTGTGRVINIETGEFQTYEFTDPPTTFVNDVVLTRDFAWFTDSQQAQLYGVPLSPSGTPGDDFVTLPLTGDWVQIAGMTNANGIAQTPNRKALLVVNTAAASLFRVDPATGIATLVNLGGYTLTNGDGLLVRGTTLYVVQNRLNQVAVFKINADGTSGELVDILESDDFDVPTTVAAFGNSLYLPNARFNTVPDPATAEYWITRIDRH